MKTDNEGCVATILVAEDESTVRAVLAKILRVSGYRVLESSTTEEALRLALQHPGGIDLVVADVGLPSSHGLLLADVLPLQRPDLPILYCSGSRQEDLEGLGLLPPNVPFLAKPFSLKTLCELVRHLLEPSAAHPGLPSTDAD